MPLLTFASSNYPSTPRSGMVTIWDIQAGVFINRITVDYYGVLAVNQRIIALLGRDAFCVYDGLTGRRLCDGTLPPSRVVRFDAHWTHGDSFRFAMSSETDGELVTGVYELQPASSPPLVVVNSFPAPLHHGEFCFSPITLHACLYTLDEVVILNLRDSKVLFQSKGLQGYSDPVPRFSPDGRFFAFKAREREITVLENTPAGYVTWSVLKPRLEFEEFSFSPFGSSIMSWGLDGIQLLDYSNPRSAPSPAKIGSDNQYRRHLVAYSQDGTRIITARKGSSVVTVLDTLSGTPQRSVNTNVPILGLGIVGDTIYITDAHELVSWDLEACGTVQGARGAGRVTVNLALHTRADDVKYAVFSRDCSQIAFATYHTVLLYDVRAQGIVGQHREDREIMTISFSPGGCDLHVDFFDGGLGTHLRVVEMETGRDQCCMDTTWFEYGIIRSHHSYGDRDESQWVEDSGGNKVLWLPPSWRAEYISAVRWDGNFLALVDGTNPVPIIIEFQPRSLLSLTCSTDT